MIKVLAAVAMLVLAQDGGGKGKEGGDGAKGAPKAASLTFTQIDANGDGTISKAEWLAFFTKLDANKDGSISVEESSGNAAGGEGGKKKNGDGGGKKGGEGR